MNIKTFTALVILLAALVAAAMVLNRKPDSRVRIAGVAGGDPVFRELDVNNINAIEIGTMTSTIRLSRAESGWVSDTLFQYPADFSRIASFLRKLNDLKVDQVLRDGEVIPAEIGVDPAASGPERTTVTLSYAGSRNPVVFLLGALKESGRASPMDMGDPSGRFMRAGDGPVIQINDLFLELDAPAEDWVKRELVQLSADQIASVEVVTTNGAFVLSRDSAGPYKLSGQAEEEKVDDAVAAQLFQGLQWLRFDGVADPALPDLDAGIHEFDVAKYTTKTGMVYQLEMGRDQGTGSRALRIKVSDQSEGAVHTAQVDELNRKLSGWRYRMPAGSLSQIAITRESLIAKPVEAAPEAAESETGSTESGAEAGTPADP